MKEKLNAYIDQMTEAQLRYIVSFIELLFFASARAK